MREYLSGEDVPFEDRNIRGSEAARAELAARTSDLIVPQLFWGAHHVVGFDLDELADVVAAYRAQAA